MGYHSISKCIYQFQKDLAVVLYLALLHLLAPFIQCFQSRYELLMFFDVPLESAFTQFLFHFGKIVSFFKYVVVMNSVQLKKVEQTNKTMRK